MAKTLLDDKLWMRIGPLLPAKERRFRYPGRKPISNRQALTGILFILKTGTPWKNLSLEVCCGRGMSCWRRLKEWHEAGIWQKVHETLLAELNSKGQIDWQRAVVDSSSVRAVHGEKNRAESDGSAPTGEQAPSHQRCPGEQL